jgi:hypothetical protein
MACWAITFHYLNLKLIKEIKEAFKFQISLRRICRWVFMTILTPQIKKGMDLCFLHLNLEQ